MMKPRNDHERETQLLTAEQRRFLARRAPLVHAWRLVGPVLLVSLLGLGLWLAWFAPLLANPFVVLARLEANSLACSTMALSAAILPVVVLLCLLLAIVLVIFAFVAFAHERRYLVMVERLGGVGPPGSGQPDIPRARRTSGNA
jgi:hypothetical protein